MNLYNFLLKGYGLGDMRRRKVYVKIGAYTYGVSQLTDSRIFFDEASGEDLFLTDKTTYQVTGVTLGRLSHGFRTILQTGNKYVR